MVIQLSFDVENLIKYTILCQYSINQLSGVVCRNTNQFAFGFHNSETRRRVFRRQVNIRRSLQSFRRSKQGTSSRSQYKILPADYNPLDFFYPYQQNGSGPQLIHLLPHEAYQSQFDLIVDTMVSKNTIFYIHYYCS